ncbi:MAG: MATE family efflux transporter [Tissierellia bacterium]|nr:MATE family efflux transporter [Tissierellia bacterium]
MKDKDFYKIAIKMAWPSVLESFFIALAGMIDTIMVGSLGNFAIASVGLTTQPKFIGFTIFFALNIALSALVARRRGQGDKKGANQVFMTAITISLVLCLIISVSMVVFAGQIMQLAGSNFDTHEASVSYFQIIMGGMIFNVVAMIINAAQRGSGNTKIAFVTNLTSSIVNIVFNYLLIGGKFGFPALGIKGAALATVFGSFLAMILSIRSLFHRDSLIEFNYIRNKNIMMNLDSLKSLFSLASTMFVENIAMRIGFLATALTAAKLGTDAFAVHNAGMNILSLGFSFGDGMQVAAVALAGRSLGENKPDLAIKYGYICQRIGLLISILLSLILMVFGKNIMALYFDQLEVINMGIMITRFIMVIVLLQISQLIFAGCLRSGGDVKYTMITGFVSVTIIRTAVTLTSVNVFSLGLTGIWMGILADQASRFIMFALRFRGRKWTKISI